MIKNINITNNSNDSIIVSIDKRTELLGILMWITDYHKKYNVKNIDLANNEYIQNIIEKFSKYKDEKTVKDFEKLYNNHHYFGYDSPINLFLQLDDNLKCDKLNDYVFKEILDSDDFVYEFIDELEEFAKKIGFDEYYNNNQDLYLKNIANIKNQIDESNLKEYLNNYYGYDIGGFCINLLPFASLGGYNVTLDNMVYSNVAVDYNAKKDNLFPSTYIILHLHEFSHGYVDALTDKYKLVTEKTSLFDDIKEDMAKQAYPTDKQILNEHIIRAIEARYILNDSKDIDKYNLYIENEISLGFKYLSPILNSLEEYENNRDIYKTFDEFYPNIIENIKNYKLENTINKNT